MTSKELRFAQMELAKRLKIKQYANNPLLWLEERMGENPDTVKWSLSDIYKNHRWDGDTDPLYQAWQALADGHWAALESATGTGKTYTLSRIVFWFLDCFRNALVVTSAPKESQLKLHLWSEINKAFDKFRSFRPNAELFTLRLLPEGTQGDSEDSSWMAVGFVAGVGANEESATKAQGFHREHMLIITEETPGMNHAVMKAFENTSTGNHNLILAVGNPDSQNDVLHTFTKSSRVKSFRISAYDHPNVVANEEIYKGAVTVKSINFRKEKYGEESSFFKSRIRGISPAQSIDSLIEIKWLEEAVMAGIETDGSPNSLGIDVANSETGDMAALAWFRGNTLEVVQEFQCKNATHLAYNVVLDDFEIDSRRYENYHTHKISEFGVMAENIGIDAVGIGVATVNAFYDMKIEVISLQGGELKDAIVKDVNDKPLYKFNSLRSQMYFELREDLRQKKLNIALKDKAMVTQLIDELTNHRYSTSKGVIVVEPKEDIKKRLGKSPNVADAIVYANWMRKNYYKSNAIALPLWGG